VVNLPLEVEDSEVEEPRAFLRLGGPVGFDNPMLYGVEKMDRELVCRLRRAHWPVGWRC